MSEGKVFKGCIVVSGHSMPKTVEDIIEHNGEEWCRLEWFGKVNNEPQCKYIRRSYLENGVYRIYGRDELPMNVTRKNPALVAQELHGNLLQAVLYLANCVPGIRESDGKAIVEIANGTYKEEPHV